MKMKSPSSNSFEFSSHEPTFGCVSAILRHFLRRHKISNNENCTEEEQFSTKETKAQSPNIVARLMGLDSMPVLLNSSDLNYTGRSRSTNSVESWPGILSERTNASPVKNSVSFYEKPIYLREENEKFLLLSFAPDEKGEDNLLNWDKPTSNCSMERKKRRIKRRQSREKRTSDSRQKKEENCRKLQGVKRIEGMLKCEKNGELPLILDLEKFKLMKRKVETECLSQNSSPVSVLDLPETHDECPTEPNSPNSGAQGATPQAKQQNARRELSSNFENSEGSFSPSKFHANEESNKLRKCEIQFCDPTVVKYFVEEDLKNSIWVEREIKRPTCAEEIAIDIGLEILDLLLSEATSEFCF